MFVNPLEEYNKIFKFLGCRPLSESEFIFQPDIYKSNYVEKITEDEFKYLYKIYEPLNEKLYKFLGHKIPSWENKYKSYNLS